MKAEAAASQYVQTSIREHVARVRLNRPPVNALNRDLTAELTEVALRLRRQVDVWVVTLAASGSTFCAGADLKERAGIPRYQVAGVVRNIQRMVMAWMNIPQPVIAGLQGPALGGGLELALAADIILASEDARLGLPEVGLGIIPAAGGIQRLAQRASLGTAAKWVLSGAQFTAAEALRDGVLDHVFPARSFATEFERFVSQVASCAPLALRQAKQALTARIRPLFRSGLKTEMECYRRLIYTKDRSEALRAFAGKRRPVWQNR